MFLLKEPFGHGIFVAKRDLMAEDNIQFVSDLVLFLYDLKELFQTGDEVLNFLGRVLFKAGVKS